MKKFNILVVALFAMVAQMWAYDFKSGDLYYNIVSESDKTAEVTFQAKNTPYKLSSVTVPSSVKGNKVTYKVVAVGDLAFANSTSLKSITLPSEVTKIGGSAFSGCTALNTVNLPATLTTVGTNAFYSCVSLNMIQLPAALAAIPDGMFMKCSGLFQITIPEGVSSIGRGAFLDCLLISEVTIPASVKEIKAKAFKGTMLYTTPANWENGKVLYIGNWLIEGKELNGMYTLQAATKAIADEAFENSKSLSSVYFPMDAPIELGNSIFPSSVKNLFVQCGKVETFQKAESWKSHASKVDVVPTLYNITATVKDIHGLVNIEKGSSCDNTATLTANPFPGWHFVKWSDGNTDNPRELTLTEDVVLEAEMEADSYTITVSANDGARGTVTSDATEAAWGDTITIEATANTDYVFISWKDGNTDNPRKIKMSQDTVMTAIFRIGYEVTFVDWDDTVLAVDTVGDCEAATAPEKVEREGYVFTGWDNDFSFVTSSMTVKAQYEEILNALIATKAEEQEVVKFFEQGHLYIRKNGHIYNFAGKQIK